MSPDCICSYISGSLQVNVHSELEYGQECQAVSWWKTYSCHTPLDDQSVPRLYMLICVGFLQSNVHSEHEHTQQNLSFLEEIVLLLHYLDDPKTVSRLHKLNFLGFLQSNVHIEHSQEYLSVSWRKSNSCILHLKYAEDPIVFKTSPKLSHMFIGKISTSTKRLIGKFSSHGRKLRLTSMCPRWE